jgi:hypothetical protein
MAFTSPFNEIYADVIRRACTDFGLQPIRADEVFGPGLIIEDISSQLERSRIVIADITPKNPKVYFEVGYAQAARNPIILLAEKGTQLPFDVSGFRTLFYENSIYGRTRFDQGPRNHLAAIIGPGAQPDVGATEAR